MNLWHLSSDGVSFFPFREMLTLADLIFRFPRARSPADRRCGRRSPTSTETLEGAPGPSLRGVYADWPHPNSTDARSIFSEPQL